MKLGVVGSCRNGIRLTRGGPAVRAAGFRASIIIGKLLKPTWPICRLKAALTKLASGPDQRLV
jgi:hypothetical protein